MLARSAMGMKWISPNALLRNALIAAGSRGDAAIRPLVAAHAETGDETVRAEARWALGRLP
jgi:epoxyqueuosine reductase QueG